jgi:hypothetical protein
MRATPGIRLATASLLTAISALGSAAMAEDTLFGQQLFPANSPWNQQITNAPVASTSAAIIANIGNPRFSPAPIQDVGTHNFLYDIPYNVAHSQTQTMVTFIMDGDASESDVEAVPLPAHIQIEGDYMDGPNPVTGYGTGGRGDSHLIVWDQDTNIDYEFFKAVRPGELNDATGTTDPTHWHASGESVWNMNQNSFRPIGWTSVNAAGTSILSGMMRPDEGLTVAQGGQGVITHSIIFTLENATVLDQFIFPAEHHANPGNSTVANESPMGARFRLKASVDISGFNPQSKIIAQAMKDYGMILTDNSGPPLGTAFADDAKDTNNNPTLTWDQNDTYDTVHGVQSLHLSDFEVVNLTPIVTSLSPTHGAAGDTITVIGQNFSGSAGHLSVFFGGSASALGTPSATVAVTDDAHVTATVPTGLSGTVNVRVLSGIYGSAANDVADGANGNVHNYEGNALPGGGPIFGYGISAIVSADSFSVTAGSSSTGSPTSGSSSTGSSSTGSSSTGTSGSGSATAVTGATGATGGVPVTPGNGGGGGGGCGFGALSVLLGALAGARIRQTRRAHS